MNDYRIVKSLNVKFQYTLQMHKPLFTDGLLICVTVPLSSIFCSFSSIAYYSVDKARVLWHIFLGHFLTIYSVNSGRCKTFKKRRNKFWFKHRFSYNLIILVLLWKNMHLILGKDLLFTRNQAFCWNKSKLLGALDVCPSWSLNSLLRRHDGQWDFNFFKTKI